MTRRRALIFIVIILCCDCFQSFAQTFKFNKIDKPLKQNGVTCIIQDSFDYLWVGTVAGLHRFDGMDYEIYESTLDTTSLTDSEVRSMLEDSQGRLWIGTIKGLCLYDREKNNFIRYDLTALNNPLDKRNPEITSIVEDSQGTIWVANVREGLFFLSTSQEQFEVYDSDILETKNITTLHLQNDSVLWIGTFDDGLTRLNLKQQTVSHFRRDPDNPNSINLSQINSIITDDDQNLYAAGSFGIDRLAPGDTVFHHFPVQKSNFYKLFIDSKNRFWAAGVNSGMHLYDKDSDEFVLFEKDPTNPLSIPSNTFWDVYEDRENRIWMGSTLDGLIVIDEYLSQFDRYDREGNSVYELSNHNIRFLYEDDDENLWIATDGGGLNYFNRKTHQYSKIRHEPNNPKSLGADAVLTICEVSSESLWVGTWQGGVSIVNPKTLELTPFQAQNPDFLKVMHIIQDSNDLLWFATIDGGISSYDLANDKLMTYKNDVTDPNSIISNRVRYIFEDSRQNIWIGTSESGVDLLKKQDIASGKFTHFGYDATDSTQLPAAVVNHIMEDHLGNIWIGTVGALSRFEEHTGTFKSYKFDEQNFVAAAIAEDDKGLLWISSSQGVIRFDPKTGNFRKYGKEDGLQTGEFSRYCVTRTKRGEIAFGGENGFNLFFPERIKDNIHPPEVYITQLKLFNNPVEINGPDGVLPMDISLLDELTLTHEQSVFTLDFIAINYTSAEKNSYAYRLEGLEEDWNFVENQRSATYTNLDPGDYTFHVKAANNHGVWNEQGRSLLIHVLPPWWKTGWAMALWALLVLGGLTSFYLVRVNTLKRQKQKLEVLVAERTEDLEKQSRELQKTNEELKAYDHMVSHDLKGPIGQVYGFADLLRRSDSSRLSEEDQELLNFLLKSSITANELIDELLTFASADKPETLEKQVDVEEQVNKAISAHQATIQESQAKVRVEALDLLIPGVSIKVYQLFYNLIGNALKFQDGTRVPEITISKRTISDQIEIVVEDNGIGFDSDDKDVFQPFVRNSNSSDYAGHGIGLGTCKRIADYHGWTIRAESKVGKGSRFIVGVDTKV